MTQSNWTPFIAELEANGVTPELAAQLIGEAMKQRAYRAEYNKRDEVKAKHADYMKRYNEEKKEGRKLMKELVARGVDITKLIG